jgi:hypothetical protein
VTADDADDAGEAASVPERSAETKSAPSTEKRKKKRKKRAAADTSAAAAPTREDFAAEWPAHPELDALLAAFDVGNYALVRERGGAALQRGKADALPAEVQAAVRELLRRIEPDRTAVIMLGVAVVLMVFLGWFYWTHPHAG